MNHLITTIKSASGKSANKMQELESHDSLFKTFRAIKPLISSEERLSKLITEGIEISISNLSKDLQDFRVDYQYRKYSKLKHFPLEKLISLNKSILDAIKN